MGLPIDPFTTDGVIDDLLRSSSAGEGGYVMTPNVDNLQQISQNPELFDRAMSADIRVADGMPLIWASHIQGTPLPGRVAGSDLIMELAASIASAARTLFLLGGNEGTADRAANVLHSRSPDLRIVGTYCPPNGYERDPHEMSRIRAVLLSAQPDFVYVGLPFDKASALAAQLRSVMPATWFIGLGISFSFVCGDVSRAPHWMQRAGLEWIHRLAQEPRRLFHRYLIDDFPFAVRLLLSSARARRRLSRLASEGQI